MLVAVVVASMTQSLQQYGVGAGIPLGAGVAATAATVAGLGDQLAVVTGFGVAGGLLVGAFAGLYADSLPAGPDWARRLAAVTVLASAFGGVVLGALTAWTASVDLLAGAGAGGAAGGAFGVLLSGVLVAAGRRQASGGGALRNH
ncbi:MAG: hypothetical protein ABEJ90_01090 [Halobacterium sp.]